MRSAVLVLLILVAQLVHRPARADEPPHVRLDFSASKNAPECDRGPILLAMIDAWLRAPLFKPPIERVLSVRIERRGRRYHVRMEVQALEGAVLQERTLEYPVSVSCFEVVFNTAVNGRDMIDPPRRLAPPPPPAPCPVCEACPPLPPPPPKPAPLPKTAPSLARPDERMRWRAVAGLFYGLNVGPAPAPGAQIGAQAQGSRWSIEVDGRYTLHTTSTPKITTLTSFTAGAAVAPCWRAAAFGFCGVALVGALGWRAERWQELYDIRFYAGLGGRVTAELALPIRSPWPLAARLEIEGARMIRRPDMLDQWGKALVWPDRRFTGHGGISLVATF